MVPHAVRARGHELLPRSGTCGDASRGPRMRRSPCRRICYAAAAARGAGVPGRDAPLCRRIQALVFPAQLAPRNPEARMNPLVSIIIPCFNAEHWVSAAIESALGQTWRETEVIAINDGSSDGSQAVLRRYVGPRVQVIDRPNRGAAPRSEERR